jgi:hypothetical protein
MKRTARAVIGMVVLTGALSGCASGTPSSSDVQTAPTNVVATTTPKPVPKPAGKTVIRMDGALTRNNVGAVPFGAPVARRWSCAPSPSRDVMRRAGPVAWPARQLFAPQARSALVVATATPRPGGLATGRD